MCLLKIEDSTYCHYVVHVLCNKTVSLHLTHPSVRSSGLPLCRSCPLAIHSHNFPIFKLQHLFVLLDWIFQIQVSKMLQIFFWVIITMSRTCTYSVFVEYIHQIWFWAAYVFVAILHTCGSQNSMCTLHMDIALLIFSHMEIKH